MSRRSRSARGIAFELLVVAIAIGLAYLWMVNDGPMAFGRWLAEAMQRR